MAESETFTTTELATEDVTVVEVRTSKGIVATGSAKKHPKDEPNKFVGSKLALARALRLLADGFEAEAGIEMESTTRVKTGSTIFDLSNLPEPSWTALGNVTGQLHFTDVDGFNMFRV